MFARFRRNLSWFFRGTYLELEICNIYIIFHGDDFLKTFGTTLTKTIGRNWHYFTQKRTHGERSIISILYPISMEYFHVNSCISVFSSSLPLTWCQYQEIHLFGKLVKSWICGINIQSDWIGPKYGKYRRRFGSFVAGKPV